MDDMDDANSRNAQRHESDAASWRIVEHVPLPGASAAARGANEDPLEAAPPGDPAGAGVTFAAPSTDAPVYWEFDRPKSEPGVPGMSWAATGPAMSSEAQHLVDAGLMDVDTPAALPLGVGATDRASQLGGMAPRARGMSHPYETPSPGGPASRRGGPRVASALGVINGRRPGVAWLAAPRIVQALDRFLLAAVLLVVALCAVGVMAAEASPQANHFIISIAHIDVRASIGHLMAWLRRRRP